MQRLSQEQRQALQAAGASPAAVTKFSRALDALRLAARPTGKTLAADARKRGRNTIDVVTFHHDGSRHRQ